MAVPGNILLDEGGVSIGQIGYEIGFDLLDSGRNLLGSVATLTASGVSANTTAQIMRTLTGVKITSNEMRDIDPFTHRLRPKLTLGDGSEWPLGVFVFVDQADELAKGVFPVDLALSDQGAIFDQPTIRTFSFAPGSSVTDAIAAVVAYYGIRFVDIPTGAGTPIGSVGATWAIGSKGNAILSELCALGGFLPGYFDNNGTYTIRSPQPHPDADFDIDSMAGKVLAGSVKRRSNILSAYNAFVVIDTAPKAAPICAIAFVDSQLPWAKENRDGYVVPSIIRTQGLDSQTQAQQMADAAAASAGTGFAEIDYASTVPDPRHDLFQNLRWDGVLYREVAHTFGLSSGISQTHKIVQGGFTVG